MSDLASLMALLRGLHLAAMLSLLGAAGFIVWLLPTVEASPPELCRRLYCLCRLSGGIALLAGTAWFVLQAAAIADADTWSALLDALPVVAVHTHYGTTMLVRLLLLVLVAACLARRGTSRGLYLILALSAIALGLQGLIGHAGAMAGMSGHGLVFSEALHLLAAGLWLGALLPLWLSVRVLPLAQAAALCERFTPMGLACVLMLAGSGFAQGIALIGSLPGLLGTAYGHLALLKISLFLIALVLALLNRLWLADRLAAGRTEARRHLMLSICVETGMGLAIVGAAAFMASTTPATEATPVWPSSALLPSSFPSSFPWPFPWRFGLDGITADLGAHGAVIIGAALIGGAALVVLGAVLWRHFLVLALLVLSSTVMLHSASDSLPVAIWPQPVASAIPSIHQPAEAIMNTTIQPKAPPRRVLYAIMGVVLAALLLGAGGFMWLSGNEGNGGLSIGGPFTLQDGSGKTVTDRNFRGQYMLVYFGYTFCPDVCPTTLTAVADAMDKLGPEAPRIRTVFITVDPKRDTPAVVGKYAAAFGPNVVGLTGAPDEIARVAKEYRVYYAEHRTGPEANDYVMDHSSVLYLMDPKGGFVAPVRADQSGSEMATALKKLMG